MKQLKQIIQQERSRSTTASSINMMKQIYRQSHDTDKFLKRGIISLAKEIVHNFALNDEMKEVFGELFLYFTGNESRFDLNKGIYLHGDYGVGKTVTMQIFSKFLQRYFNFSPNNFGITSVEEIAEYYKDTGNLLKYGRNYEDGKLICHHKCINEFGKPITERNYGTNIQTVINSMLMVRYELFQEKQAITHATSNYHPSELECFDDALLDRFKEMFNFVKFSGESLRR